MNLKSSVAALTVVLVLFFLLSGFATDSHSQEKASLTVITQWKGEDAADLGKFVKIYEEKTGVQMKVISAGEKLRTKLPLAFEAERAPADLIFIPWIALSKRFAREGHLEPVGPLFNHESFKPLMDMVSIDDFVFGVPLKVSVKPGFAYKKSFFEKHDLAPPETYKEFKKLLREINQISGIESVIASGDTDGWPLTDVVEGFIIGLGGVDLFQDIIAGKKNFTSPEVREIMEEFTSLLKYFSEPGEIRHQIKKLWEEKYALFWSHKVPFAGKFEEHPEEVGYFPVPGTEGLTGAPSYMMIPKYLEPRKKEAAKDFLRWMGTKEAQTKFVEIRHQLAGHQGVPPEVYGPVMTQIQALLKPRTLLPDMDDIIGGEFLEAFRQQLKLLWASPGELESVLETLAKVAPAAEK